MIGARQRIGHMTVVGHPTNLDVWSVTIHSVLLVLQPANHNAGIRPCGSWGNNNTIWYSGFRGVLKISMSSLGDGPFFQNPRIL